MSKKNINTKNVQLNNLYKFITISFGEYFSNQTSQALDGHCALIYKKITHTNDRDGLTGKGQERYVSNRAFIVDIE